MKQFICMLFLLLPIFQSAQTTLSREIMGTASDVFYFGNPLHNQVAADHQHEMIAFGHRQNDSIWPSGDDQMRYDLSTDGGATWTTDKGPLNFWSLYWMRAPQLVFHDSAGQYTKLIYAAHVYDTSFGNAGHVSGVCDTSGTSCTENYFFTPQAVSNLGGLTEGKENEYWMVENEFSGGAFTGKVLVYKGVYNISTGDVDWSIKDTISPAHSLTHSGKPFLTDPSIAFSPDGLTGWIAWLGDMSGGSDSVWHPVLMKSTDAGATWGSPIEVSPNLHPWVADSLQTFFKDSNGDPLASTTATTGHQFDLTVDSTGNPYLVTVIGTAHLDSVAAAGYTFEQKTAKFLGGFYSTDQGATWDLDYIAPILAYSGFVGMPDSIEIFNAPQISRNDAGSHIFFAWIDQDTCTPGVDSCCVNTHGGGNTMLTKPQLRIASSRVCNGRWRTLAKTVTYGDSIFDGNTILFSLAPKVVCVSNAPGSPFELSIVGAEMNSGSPSGKTQFWYLAPTIDSTEYRNFGTGNGPGMHEIRCKTVDEGDDHCDTTGVSITAIADLPFTLSPNPSKGKVTLRGHLPGPGTLTIEVFDLRGKALRSEAITVRHAHLRHDLDFEGWAPGVYFLQLSTGARSGIAKLVLTR